MIAAVGDFHIDRWRACQQAKGSRFCRDHDTEGGTGHRLAIIAVAQQHVPRINLRFKGQISAETRAIDFHAVNTSAEADV